MDIVAPVLDSESRRQCAILLDVDGTILDLASTPREVWVPPSLRHDITRLSERTGGARGAGQRPLAGRSRSAVRAAAAAGDRRPRRRIPAASTAASAIGRATVPLDAALKRKFALVAEIGPGIIIEDKGYSVALALSPGPEPGRAWSRRRSIDICADNPAAPIEVLRGKSVVEIKQAGFNKGTAVRELMRYPPFAGPPSDLHRRRRHRRVGVRRSSPEFDGLAFSVGRDGGGRRRALREAGGRARLARPDRATTAKAAGAMTDHGLDLAVIGNGRTAALVDPCSRIVWWCFPRFDGDPIFCRLLAGDEEKGLLRRRARRHGRISNPSICATPRSSRRS